MKVQFEVFRFNKFGSFGFILSFEILLGLNWCTQKNDFARCFTDGLNLFGIKKKLLVDKCLCLLKGYEISFSVFALHHTEFWRRK